MASVIVERFDFGAKSRQCNHWNVHGRMLMCFVYPLIWRKSSLNVEGRFSRKAHRSEVDDSHTAIKDSQCPTAIELRWFLNPQVKRLNHCLYGLGGETYHQKVRITSHEGCLSYYEQELMLNLWFSSQAQVHSINDFLNGWWLRYQFADFENVWDTRKRVVQTIYYACDSLLKRKTCST